MTDIERALATTSWSSAPAAPACARRSRPASQGLRDRDHLQVAVRQGAHRDGRGRHRRLDGQRQHATTTGRCTSATPCAAASSSTTGGWPSCTRKEAPDRVWELETYGALFDRTTDGRISQRNFGGHEYPRLAHVGDRTGLELIRTLQQKIVSLPAGRPTSASTATPTTRAGCKVFAEVHDHRAAQGRRRRDRRRVRLLPGDRARFVVFEAPAVVLATGGIGKSFKVTSNSWEYTGDGHALALRAGADADQHGVRPVPPDRHGLAAVGEGHPGHRVGPR